MIQSSWRILEGRSLVLCAERRLGKTCVIKKMVAEAPQDGFLPIYRERVDTCYSHDGDRDERKFALNLLDILSANDKPLSFGDLFDLLKSRVETENREMARHVLTLLQRDHYIILQTDGLYRFRFPLIKRWWRLHRG